MNKNIFIGGAWPYANNSLHLGHLAALLPGDVIARYYRKHGDNVLYVSGTDCHGTPITVRAQQEGVNPESIALGYHKEFSDCFSALGFTYNNYSFTHSDFHQKVVKDLIRILYENDLLYESTEPQDYCEHCNRFLSDREVEGQCPICGGHARGDQCDTCLSPLNPSELKNKTCKICGTPVSSKQNKHLYWKLSNFQNEISEYLKTHKEIWRFNAINETEKYLNNGLRDRAITRQLTWGVDVPINGFEDKKLYVWIEAVLGYISAGIQYCEENGLNWKSFYVDSDNLDTYYIHGKDNIPFHTIIFPALLLSLKNGFQLPNHIISSEFLNINDTKISKSLGNGITVKDLLKSYNADTIRYCLISQAPEKKDANFTIEVLEQFHNKCLAGEYGNFVNRNLAFLVKKFRGIIPEGIVDPDVRTKIEETYILVGDLIAKGELRSAIQEVQKLVHFSNKYYDEHQPWIQIKKDQKAFNNTTATCISLIANIANLYEPFIPFSSAKVFSFFGITNPSWNYVSVAPGTVLNSVSILFSKIEH